jgi:hypothetical protein
MKRLLSLLSALLVVLLVAAPAAVAAGPELPQNGRVLIALQGDVTLPAGEQAEAIIVINGNALILGTVNTVTVIRGTATLDQATVETLTVVDGRAVLQPGTQITRDVVQLNSTVERGDGVIIGGTIRSLADNAAGFAAFLGFAAIAIWVGAALMLLLAALALAALAARQVRSAEAIISTEPLKAFLVGLGMVIVPPLLIVLLAITLFGLPLALSLLFLIWPALAFVGYLVAAIWLGEWLLRAAGRRRPAERPYMAAVVGVLVAGLVGLIPLVSAIISVFGLGAVTVAGWRTLTGGGAARPTFQPSPQPMGA